MLGKVIRKFYSTIRSRSRKQNETEVLSIEVLKLELGFRLDWNIIEIF